MNILIRRATLADAKTIAEHNIAMALETESLQLDPGRVLPGVQAVLGDSGKGFYFVAESDGQIAGQLMVTFEWSDWRNGTFWWVQSVYVRPASRRQGVYRRLYKRLREEAESRPDVCGLRLYVSSENRAAQQVYSNLGMHAAHYQMYEVDFVLQRGD
jgi:GNAT superfamily N-acetyltransferase